VIYAVKGEERGHFGGGAAHHARQRITEHTAACGLGGLCRYIDLSAVCAELFGQHTDLGAFSRAVYSFKYNKFSHIFTFQINILK
jgi:hypothetical protein